MTPNKVMHYNSKAIVTVLVICGIIIYLSYTTLPGLFKKRHSVHVFKSWKTHKFVPIPKDILQAEHEMKERIQTRYISVDSDDQTYKILIRQIDGRPGYVPVLFLHGMSFQSHNWTTLGILTAVAAFGHPVTALDLPGHGQSEGQMISHLDALKNGRFLEAFIRKADIERPVIIAPSMGGQYAIPYMMKKEPTTCTQRLRGLVAVAPTNTHLYTPAQYHRCEVPAMLVYGSKDKHLGLGSVGDLRNLPNSEIEKMDKAGHACYIERPAEFNMLVYNFLLAVQREEQDRE